MEDIIFLLVFVGLLFLFIIYVYFKHIRISPDFQRESEEKKYRDRLVAFYQECTDMKCTKISTPQVKEKICLVAQKHGLSYPGGIEKLWEDAIAAKKSKEDESRQIELEKLKAQELADYEALNRYSTFQGREKRVAILTNERDELVGAINAARQLSRTLVSSAQLEKEHNPYLWGGIVNGLGGPGLFTAIQTEQENVEIRKRNETRIRMASAQSNEILLSTLSHQDKVTLLEKELDHVKTCLVADIPASQIFHLLAISSSHVTVSKTGAFTVTAKIKAKNPLTIYDNMAAVADGSIVAHVLESGREIGTATLVFPAFGIDDSQEFELKGIGLDGADKGNNHTVTFTASNLWLMER